MCNFTSYTTLAISKNYYCVVVLFPYVIIVLDLIH